MTSFSGLKEFLSRGIRFRRTRTGNYVGIRPNPNTDPAVSFYVSPPVALPTSGTQLVTIDSSGNMGITPVPGGGGGGGVSDHGLLSGLANDDHVQYLNQARGDARYYRTGQPIADSDIPSAVARDSEVNGAIATHAATNDHPVATALAKGMLSNTDKAKLDAIANAATANSTDSQLRDRSTHTGTQLASTVSNLSEAVDDRVAALLVAGANVTLTYDDAGNALTIAASGAGGAGGETNTASNVGVGGVSVFRQKTGVNLEFRSINAASGKISVSLDATNNEIDIDLAALTESDIPSLDASKITTGAFADVRIPASIARNSEVAAAIFAITPLSIGAPSSNPTAISGASAIANIISLSQASYNAIATKDPSTLYVIVT